MKTVGEILKQARLAQGISMVQVAARTKIQVKYLRAVEENRLDSLPAATFAKGFIRNYARVVGKNPESLLAIFRRDYGQNETGQVVPRGWLAGGATTRWQWTPTATAVSLATLAMVGFAGYLGWQWQQLRRLPKLEISFPQENQVVETNVRVDGKTDADATVMVNNKTVIINQDGNFNDVVLLPSGKHTVTVKATGRNGKTRTIQRTVEVERSD